MSIRLRSISQTLEEMIKSASNIIEDKLVADYLPSYPECFLKPDVPGFTTDVIQVLLASISSCYEIFLLNKRGQFS